MLCSCVPVTQCDTKLLSVGVQIAFLTLSNKVLLKLLQELQIQQIIRGERLFSHHGLHGLDILTDSVTGILQTHTHCVNYYCCIPTLLPSHTLFMVQRARRFTSWFDTSAWSFRVIPSPMADFIKRDREGSTLIGG